MGRKRQRVARCLTIAVLVLNGFVNVISVMYSGVSLSSRCFHSVVVITCVSHVQGPPFDPDRKHFYFVVRGITFS